MVPCRSGRESGISGEKLTIVNGELSGVSKTFRTLQVDNVQEREVLFMSEVVVKCYFADASFEEVFPMKSDAEAVQYSPVLNVAVRVRTVHMMETDGRR